MRRIMTLSLLFSVMNGAEFEIKDIRLGFEYGITYSQEEAYNYGIVSTQEVDADLLGLSLSYIDSVRPIGDNGLLFIGGQLNYERINSDDLIIGVRYESKTELMGAGIQGGYAFQLPQKPELHLELGLMGSYLIGAKDRKYNNSNVAESLEGYGVTTRLGGYYKLPNKFQIGLELQYILIRDFKTGIDDTNFATSGEKHSGLLIALSFGMRL